MPGPLLHLGATVLCSHGGQAQPTAPNPRVLVNGQPTVLMSTPYVIAGCPQASIPAPFCATAQYVTAATRLTSNGQPLLLMDSQAICAPTGTPLVPVAVQTRATGM